MASGMSGGCLRPGLLPISETFTVTLLIGLIMVHPKARVLFILKMSVVAQWVVGMGEWTLGGNQQYSLHPGCCSPKFLCHNHLTPPPPHKKS